MDGTMSLDLGLIERNISNNMREMLKCTHLRTQ